MNLPGCRGPKGPRHVLGATFGLLLLVVGCASGRALNPFDSSERLDTVILRVENRNIQNVTIYGLRGRNRAELGTVPGGSLQFLNFGWPLGAPLALEIELEVGERYRLPPYPYSGGGQVWLMVSSELRRSRITR